MADTKSKKTKSTKSTNASKASGSSKKTNKSKAGKKKNTGSRKKLIIIFVVLDILLLIGVGLAVVFSVFHFDDADFVAPSEFIDDTEGYGENDDKEQAVKTLNELRDSEDLSSLLKEWATNGYDDSSLMSDKNVINFLLVGVDASGGNSDVMMLMSLDKNNHKIYLTSFMRDSYTYINTQFGDRYAKLNAAYANGGMGCLIETIQRDYKIKIDNYFVVNFNTFVEIVDIIGGIEVPVQAYEARAAGIPEYGDNVLLNGKQALWYCRIRKCDTDGDVSRTRRQRQFISAIINKTKQVQINQIDDILNSLLKYIKTDCSTTKLISLATQALTGKWYNYQIVSTTLPAPENRLDYEGAAWVWIVDYPADAVYLQNTIYGKTNIVLNTDRITAIDLMRSGKGGI